MQVRKVLRGAGLFVDADTTDRKMQKKVREAQLAQYNYILVIGEQERVSGGLRVQTALHCFFSWCTCVVEANPFMFM
jgi:threonyl-tRNA synthetase